MNNLLRNIGLSALTFINRLISGSLVYILLARYISISDFGLLFTVGEETDFAGVKQIQQEIEALNAFIVVGEPTKLKPVSAHFGIITFLVICTGKAAHSSDPSMGENAIDKLVTLLSGPISTLKVHEESLLSLVQISGGVADNIIPDQAEALFSCRISPNDMRDYVQEVQQLVGEQAQVKKVLDIPSVASSVPESLSFLGDGQTVKYGTELSFLKNGIVFGPGNIADAHGPDERIKKADLGLAVEAYQNMLKQY